MKFKASILVPASAFAVGAVGALIFGSAAAQATPTTSTEPTHKAASYNDVRAALTNGKYVTITNRFQRCVDPAGAAGPALTGSLHINGYQATSTSILFSDVHPTLDASNHPVTEYIRYTVTPENRVTVSTKTLSGESIVHSASFTCTLGDGAVFTWKG